MTLHHVNECGIEGIFLSKIQTRVKLLRKIFFVYQTIVSTVILKIKVSSLRTLVARILKISSNVEYQGLNEKNSRNANTLSSNFDVPSSIKW